MLSMKRLHFDTICQELTRILLNLGLENAQAKKCAYIFTENTCDGVTSHGLNRFPSFVDDIKSGIIQIKAEPELTKAMAAIEQWDGKRGIGPLNAEKAMLRAVELSHKHGLGCVGLSNTNHWMRGGTYGLQAAKAGCIGICWTNTIANMPPWGSAERKIGNNPLVISIPKEKNPVLLDMAMSQFSNGKLEVLRRRGDQLPLAGGYDEKGQLSTDPNAILRSSRALPIGFWKGSGLSLVLDILAALIAGGDSTGEISQREKETGISQVFIAIDLESELGAASINEKVNAILEDFLSAQPLDESSQVRYPGQGMFATRKDNLENGITVDLSLWETIQKM
ncbi:MAG TPA: 3-dehydro-L-gulonate 2-dehydrogenase [Psychromonas sp.]